MDLDQLRYFTEVVRCGTYAAAAENLAVSQPALWKRVKRLEVELGLALFERTGRTVRPTVGGLQLAETASAVVRAAEEIPRQALAISRGTSGVVRLVCAPPHLGRLAPAVSRFALENPDVELNLREEGRIDPEWLLDDGAADVVVSLESEGFTPGFRLYDVAVVAVPGGGAFPHQRSPNVGELRGRELVTAPEGFYSRSELDKACAAEGFEPKVVFESSNPAALIGFADAGTGIAVVADDTLSDAHRGRSRTLVGVRGPLIRQVWCYWRQGYAPAASLADRFRDVAD